MVIRSHISFKLRRKFILLLFPLNRVSDPDE